MRSRANALTQWPPLAAKKPAEVLLRWGAAVSWGGSGAPLSLNPAAVDWKLADYKKIAKFPVKTAEFVVAPGFKRWLEQEKGLLKDASVPQTVQNLRHILRIVDTDLDRMSIQFIKQFFREDVLALIRSTDLFSLQCTWSVKCATSLMHFCAWHKYVLDPSDDTNAQTYL